MNERAQVYANVSNWKVERILEIDKLIKSNGNVFGFVTQMCDFTISCVNILAEFQIVYE